MGMDFLQPMLLGKAVQKRSHGIRIDTSAVPFFGVEYSVFLVIPLAAVTFRLFEIVDAIFSEHFHNAVIKRQPAITGIRLAAVNNLSACTSFVSRFGGIAACA